MSKEIGGLMAKGLKDEANAIKAKVQAMADEMKETEIKEAELAEIWCLAILFPTKELSAPPLPKYST